MSKESVLMVVAEYTKMGPFETNVMRSLNKDMNLRMVEIPMERANVSYLYQKFFE